MKKYWFLLYLFFATSLWASSNIQELKNEIKKGLPKIEGWCSWEKASKMFDLIIEKKPNVCVEIGVFGGSSIFPTAMALKYNRKGVIYAIDPWDTAECLKNYDSSAEADYHQLANREWWSKVDLKKIYNSFSKMLNQYQLNNYCIVLKETSASAASKIPDIDILHIDGNHSEESALFDAVTYLPKVKAGGYIWFDDVHWTTAQKAVDYLLRFCDPILKVDNGNCILIQKR